MDPSAIRYAGMKTSLEALSHHVSDLSNLQVPFADECHVLEPKLRCGDYIVEVTASLATNLAHSVETEIFPLVLGGDHSIVRGSVRCAQE